VSCSPVKFTDAEKSSELKNWNEKGFEEFKKQVIVRAVYRGDIKEQIKTE
jgi:hypothetical protein